MQRDDSAHIQRSNIILCGVFASLLHVRIARGPTVHKKDTVIYVA
jgi:hypothetical protein